jgi:hypothetical protein
MTEHDRNGLFEKAGQALPVGRVGEPEDLAETYLYLMCERFSTGAMIVVDGGSTLVLPNVHWRLSIGPTIAAARAKVIIQ